jgi:lipopolysaccharide biosynthesis glycosyltransferase
MNFVFVFNDKYRHPSLVSLYSLLKTSPEINFNFYLIVSEISEVQIKELEGELFRFKQELSNFASYTLINIPFDEVKSRLKGLRLGSWHPMVGLKVLIPEILPQNVEEIFYADGDVIFLQSLKALINNAKLQESEFAAALDLNANLQIRSIHQNNPSLEYKPEGAKYFNTGFFFWNLKKARNKNASQSLLALLKNHSLNFLDQCALNIAYQNNFYELHPKYNACAPYRWELSFRSLSQDTTFFKEAFDNPIVFHFNGLKPWNLKCRYNKRFNEKFWDYVRLAKLEKEIPRPKGFFAFLRRLLVHINSLVAYKDSNLQPSEYSNHITKAFKINCFLGMKILWRSLRYSFKH